VCITDPVPVREMMLAVDYLRTRDCVLVGPNCPGLISPGKANMGIIAPDITTPGPVGLVSRSGTLTYQIINELSTRGIGQSTCVGIGGDPIVGSSFIDMLERFQADPDTKAVVLIGEIGGDAEERAADFIEAKMSKPVVAYIAGFSAPPGKRMGHAGAIITGSSGTAEGKAKALEAKGIRVGRTPSEVGDLLREILPR
jgi:succinyl-CoA synthetase alpha subunit